MRTSARVLASIAAAAAAACGAAEVDEGTSTTQQAAVYGDDDRKDVYAVTDAAWRDTARGSIVALVTPQAIDASDPGDLQLLGGTLQDTYGVCASEPFAAQKAIARCSGTLIDEDLVLTAGHCVAPERFDCVNDTTFVFNYAMADADTPAKMTADDVYGCAGVVAFAQEQAADGTRLDYAIVQLDRPVVAPRAPVALRAGSLSQGAAVSVIGFPSGLPAKVDRGGAVTDARDGSGDYFIATTDTFGGSSGSGVFDAERRLVGVLVRGADDWDTVEGPDGDDCLVRATYDDDGDGAGEHSTYAQRAVDALCADGWRTAICDPELKTDDDDGAAAGDVVAGQAVAGDDLDVSAPADAASCVQVRGGASTFAALLVGLAALRRRRFARR